MVSFIETYASLMSRFDYSDLDRIVDTAFTNVFSAAFLWLPVAVIGALVYWNHRAGPRMWRHGIIAVVMMWLWDIVYTIAHGGCPELAYACRSGVETLPYPRLFTCPEACTVGQTLVPFLAEVIFLLTPAIVYAVALFIWYRLR